ncbi:hypothetical protein BJV78DRAFT_342186 [Lactifluus subvellereus]|nr:hypothetical protein BJV78DRAFT_342186 [Lactifluus subvellereus]
MSSRRYRHFRNCKASTMSGLSLLRRLLMVIPAEECMWDRLSSGAGTALSAVQDAYARGALPARGSCQIGAHHHRAEALRRWSLPRLLCRCSSHRASHRPSGPAHSQGCLTGASANPWATSPALHSLPGPQLPPANQTGCSLCSWTTRRRSRSRR